VLIFALLCLCSIGEHASTVALNGDTKKPPVVEFVYNISKSQAGGSSVLVRLSGSFQNDHGWSLPDDALDLLIKESTSKYNPHVRIIHVYLVDESKTPVSALRQAIERIIAHAPKDKELRIVIHFQ
jgi:hypothetical protein